MVVLAPEQIDALAGCVVTEAGVQLVFGTIAVHKPRPYVAAANVLSPALYFNILVFTVGKVVSGDQMVEVPFNKSVLHTPVSVAMYAFVSPSG
jgi:hypothetical protein